MSVQGAVEDLFDLLHRTDPSRTPAVSDQLRSKARALSERLRELSSAEARAQLAERLRVASEDLARFAAAVEKSELVREWREHHAAIAKDYAALTQLLEKLGPDHRFKRLSPINYTRNAFHISSGVIAALMYHFFLNQLGAALIMAILAGTFTTLEILRRRSGMFNEKLMRFGFFAKIARPHEHVRINSSTWFAWGVLIAVLFGSQRAVEAACLVCAFGDPAGSIIGKRFGKTMLTRDRSVAGTTAFFVVSALAVFLFQVFAYPQLGLENALLFAIGAALVGAAVELLSTRLDDNFTIPVSVAIAMTLAQVL